MSRLAKKPLQLPTDVTLRVEDKNVTVSGQKGNLQVLMNTLVNINSVDGCYLVEPKTDNKEAWVQAGTLRALIQNMIDGVSKGYERRLDLVGVGYRAQCKGSTISLSIGYSHPVDYPLPDGVSATTPSQTEIVLTCNDRQLLGQVAAEIRALRPPEPYKGKGIQYKGEKIHRKEAKKK